jgi:hypothetical protein
MSADFEIEIVTQGWISVSDPAYDVAARDLCTHGDLRLVIGGREIAAGDGHGQYGISEAALGLLRTVETDTGDRDERIPDRLIPHGCGTILMMGCPIGIDWTVRHIDGLVCIADVVRYDTTSDSEAVRFPGLAVEMPLHEYRDEITAFARKAKEPFEGVEKVFHDDLDRDDYVRFWEEYDRLLERGVSASGSISSPSHG